MGGTHCLGHERRTANASTLFRATAVLTAGIGSALRRLWAGPFSFAETPTVSAKRVSSYGGP